MKLETGLSFKLPDLRGVVGATAFRPTQKLRTAYFDTADLRLWQRGLSLRHRTGDEPGAGTWTLKIPTAGSGPTLDRTERSWAGPRQTLPGEVPELLRGIIRHAVLEQVTELVTARRRLVLGDVDGAWCGELDDDVVTVVGGPRDGLCFRQIEVELDPGGDAILGPVLGALRRAGAHVDQQPKLSRVLGPARARPVTRVGPRSSLRDVVQASLDDALERLLDHDYRLRLGGGDPQPHDVHQARVATRRLRSDLKTLAGALDRVWVAHTRTELKWLGAVLGAVRDADVRREHLTQPAPAPSPAETAGLAELCRRQDEQRRRASRQLSDALRSDRYLDLLDRLHAGARTPPCVEGAGPGAGRGPDDGAAHVLPTLVGRPWRKLRRKVRRAGRHPSDRALHRIRIAAKQLRYAAEMAAPVMGKPARRTARAAARLQTVLGDHHDAVTAEEWLRRASLHVAPAASFVAGRLAAEETSRQRQRRAQWRAVWNGLDRKMRRKWLE